MILWWKGEMRLMTNLERNEEEEIPRHKEDQDLEVIAEAIVDAFETLGDQQDQDSFETYSKKLRTHFYEDKQSFKKKFEQGYHVLIEEVSQS